MATKCYRSPKRPKRCDKRNRKAPHVQRRARPEPVFGEGETLRYHRYPIRVLPVNGVLHYALPDILDALGYTSAAATVLDSPAFPAHARRTGYEAYDPEVPGEPGEVVMLSPVGVLYLTQLTDALHGQGLAAWAAKTAREHCPSPPVDDKALTLTVQSDGLLPPYPTRYSGWRSQWIALKEANPGKGWAGRHRGAA